VRSNLALEVLAGSAILLVVALLGPARAGGTCEVKFVITGADGCCLINTLNERCPCADSTQRSIAGCGSNDGLILRHRAPEEANWPTMKLYVQGEVGGELFVRANGTGRPITVTAAVMCAGSERERSTTLRRARAGTTYWWRATWADAGSGKDARIEIRRLKRLPRFTASH
jgi:hypothetical protein